MSTPDVLKELAPTGTLRASINLGNIVLAANGTPDNPGRHHAGARARTRKAARRAEQSSPASMGPVAFEAMKRGEVDIVFLAIEPVRAAEIEFTAPYVIIEGCYIVPKDSALKSPADVDKPGTRIGVNKASAYDLFLTRNLKHADLDAQRGRRGGFPEEQVRGGGRGEAVAAEIHRTRSRRAADRRALHGNPSGDGLRQGQARRSGSICSPSSRR